MINTFHPRNPWNTWSPSSEGFYPGAQMPSAPTPLPHQESFTGTNPSLPWRSGSFTRSMREGSLDIAPEAEMEQANPSSWSQADMVEFLTRSRSRVVEPAAEASLESQDMLNFLKAERARVLSPEAPSTSKGAEPVRQVNVVTPTSSPSGSDTIPTLEQAFLLARRHPGKQVYLDTKTSADPAVAKRLAEQLIALLDRFPDMVDRLVIMNPDQKCLDAIRDVFKRSKHKSFKNFCLDNEKLNDANTSEADRSPLTHSKDDRYVAIGDPKSPLTTREFRDLVEEVRKARAQTSDRSSSHYGKQIVVWTINDPQRVAELARAGAHAIMTDDPEGVKATLDKLGLQGAARPQVIAHRGGPASERYSENSLTAMREGFRTSDAIEIDVCSAKDGLVVYHDNDPYDMIATARNLGLEANNPWRPTIPGLFSSLRGKRIDELTIAEIQANFGFKRNITGSAIGNLIGTHLSWVPGMTLALKLLEGLGVLSLADGIVNGAWEVGKWIVDGILEAGKTLGRAFDNLVHGRIGAALAGIVGSAGRLLGGLGKGLVKGVGALWEGVKGVGKSLWNGVKSVGESVWNGVKSVGKSVWNGVKSVGKSIGKFFSSLF